MLTNNNMQLYATPEEAMRESKKREEEERRRRQIKYDMNGGRAGAYPQSINSRVHSAPTSSLNNNVPRVQSQGMPQQYPMGALPQQHYIQPQPAHQGLPINQYVSSNGSRASSNGYAPVVPQQPSKSRRVPPQRAPQWAMPSPVLAQNSSSPSGQGVPRNSMGSIESNPQQDAHDVQIATQLFHNHDIRNNGRLTAEELQNLLQNDDNTHFCISSVDALINLFGASRFGTVNLNEFISLYKRVKKWRKVYVDNDINRSFTISVSEFHNCLQELGYLVPFNVSEKLFDQYSEFIDPNKNGKELKFDKFVETLVWLMRLTKVFRKYDDNQEGVATIHYKDFIDVALYLGRFLPH